MVDCQRCFYTKERQKENVAKVSIAPGSFSPGGVVIKENGLWRCKDM